MLALGRIRLSIFIYLFEVLSVHAKCMGDNTDVGLGVWPLPKNWTVKIYLIKRVVSSLGMRLGRRLGQISK